MGIVAEKFSLRKLFAEEQGNINTAEQIRAEMCKMKERENLREKIWQNSAANGKISVCSAVFS